MSELGDRINVMHLSKAQTAASWSFIGLLIPLLGIIIAASSLSHLKSIVPYDEEAAYEWRRIHTKAISGLVLSIILFIPGAFIVLMFLFAGVQSNS